MAELNILERYGIKEVCDVTFYEINDDGTPGAPVLYLDTLKVSTVEQTAENVAARGGKGNPELVVWDYGKEITLNLEDAVFSSKSLALMFGTMPAEYDDLKEHQSDEKMTLQKTLAVGQLKKKTVEGTTSYYFKEHGQEFKVENEIKWYDELGEEAQEADAAYAVFDVNLADGASQIDISSDAFPGTYYVTGDTYARSEKTGKDEFLQIVIPKAKMLSEVTLTMEAEGDPSTFNMSMKVLRPEDKVMMKLIKYDIEITE